MRQAVLVTMALLLCGSLGVPREARATLGSDLASVATNQQNLAATRQVRKLAVGERHDLTLPSGLVVHEYVSDAGVVWAITWQGPRLPDLRELLGPYFAQLGSRPAGAGHHRLRLTGSDFVIQSSGHNHAFTGRAWVPSLVPAGVRVESALE